MAKSMDFNFGTHAPGDLKNGFKRGRGQDHVTPYNEAYNMS